jgi:hypothetical protein
MVRKLNHRFLKEAMQIGLVMQLGRKELIFLWIIALALALSGHR